MRPSDLTVSQRGNLVRFVRSHRAITDTSTAMGIRDKDFGSKRGLEHLERKGMIRCVREERGPRGGLTRVLTPTPEGYRIADYIVVNGLKTY
jgi:hypothetical protein